MDSTMNNKSNNGKLDNSITPYFVSFFVMLGIVLVAAVVYEQNVPVYRNTLITPFLAIGCALLFVYFIYTLKDRSIEIYGKQIDTGVIVYVLILFFIFYVLGG